MSGRAPDLEPLLDDDGSDLRGWLAGLGRRLGSAGFVVVDRLPVGGDLPTVIFDGPEEEEDFVALVRALGVRVVYGQVTDWDEADVRVLQERVRRIRPAAGQASTELLAAARDRQGQPGLAVLVAIAGGVEHRLCTRPGWWRELQADLQDLEAGADGSAPGLGAGSVPGTDRAWSAGRPWSPGGSGAGAAAAGGGGVTAGVGFGGGLAGGQAGGAAAPPVLGSRLGPDADEYERARDALDRLSELLHDDETFLATCSSEPLRRRYAQQLVKQMAETAHLPADIRGAASAHAESVWQWWTTRGRPAREAALRARLPELAGDPSLVGGLEDRRRAARVLLQNVDPLAVTSELIDTLARDR